MAFVHLETYENEDGEFHAIRCLTCGRRYVVICLESDAWHSIVPSQERPDMWCPMCGAAIQCDPEQFDEQDDEEEPSS